MMCFQVVQVLRKGYILGGFTEIAELVRIEDILQINLLVDLLYLLYCMACWVSIDSLDYRCYIGSNDSVVYTCRGGHYVNNYYVKDLHGKIILVIFIL